MSNLRPGTPGSTRECPHCKESILNSARVCPACRHHLRFDPIEAGQVPEILVPLRVDASIRHPSNAPAWEYNVVVTVRNERGDEIARKVVNVGAMSANEQRSFALSVEVTPVRSRGGKPLSKH